MYLRFVVTDASFAVSGGVHCTPHTFRNQCLNRHGNGGRTFTTGQLTSNLA